MDKEALTEWEQAYRLWGNGEDADAIRREGAKGYLAAAKWQFDHDKAKATAHYTAPFWLALTAARAKETEETLRLLEEAYGEYSPRLVFLQNQPEFDFLHAEPRYQEIVRKMGPPAVK